MFRHFFLGLGLLSTFTACSISGVPLDYSDFPDEPEDRVHWIRINDLGVFHYVRIDAIFNNDHEIEESDLVPVPGMSLEKHERLRLVATPRARQAIEASGTGPELAELIEAYFGRLMSRSSLPTELPAFKVVLLRENEGVSISRRALSVSRAEVPVLVQLDSSSVEAMVISVARQIPTIAHELVHLSTYGGIISVPGTEPEESRLNEEVFASLVQLCDRYDNLQRLELGGSLEFKLHKVPSVHSDDADRHFRAIRRLGPSPAGKYIAGMILHEGLPTGVPLEAEEREGLTRRCDRLTGRPEDYVAEYVANGLPDRWDEYLVPKKNQDTHENPR